MKMCRWYFQGFTKIQNGRHGPTSIFGWAQKLKKLVWSIFLNFNITFLATCGCAIDCLKMLPKFRMVARSQLQKNFVGAKTLKLNVRIVQILQPHSPQYGNVQVTFSRFYGNLKWPPRINFNFFEVAETQQLKVVNYLSFTITFPTIWRSACDFLRF